MNEGHLFTMEQRAVRGLASSAPRSFDSISFLQAALTLWALPADPHLHVVRARLADRLRGRLDPDWIQQGDVYEVFVALTALWTYDRTIISGEHLACAVTRLVAIEANVGGPYRVPLGANACIAAFLCTVAKPLPKLDAHLQAAIERNELQDPRLSQLALIYVMERAGKGEALRHHGGASIPNEQQKDGLWAGITIVKDEQPSAITTTALHLYLLTIWHAHPTAAPAAEQHAAIIKGVQDLFIPYGPCIHATACKLADRIRQADTAHEITLLASFFAHAHKNPVPIPQSHLRNLGIASVCGWMAYMVYDDFIDGEGVPAHLPVANIAMRTSCAYYQKALPPQNSFGAALSATFATMDQANAWELASCRFVRNGQTVTIGALPQYGQGAPLADRSLAHALGPLIVLLYADVKKDTLQKTTAAFRHFLIARQLADDLHDWQEDIAAGHASFVVTAIVRDMHMQQGEYYLPQLMLDMQKTFRAVTLPKICARILHHTNIAQHMLTTIHQLHSTNDVYALFATLKNTAQQGLDLHIKSNSFLKAYRHMGTPPR
jgi:hypothetical protein